MVFERNSLRDRKKGRMHVGPAYVKGTRYGERNENLSNFMILIFKIDTVFLRFYQPHDSFKLTVPMNENLGKLQKLKMILLLVSR